MRKWIIAGSVVIVLIAVLIAALLNLNSLISRNKDYLIAQAEQALGRKITVGAVEATLFTGLGVKLGDFTMTDDPAYSSEKFVRAKDLQVMVRFWPLLKKQVQIKKIILHGPAINVVRNGAGGFNFSTIGKKDKEPKQAEAKEKPERGPKEESSSAFLISLVDISGGEMRYLDRKNGTDLRLRQIDLKVEDIDLNRPIGIKLAAAVYAEGNREKRISDFRI